VPEADGNRVERNGPLGLAWLARPGCGNAFTPARQIELHRQLYALDRDEDVRVILITKEGKLFSAGTDVESGGSNLKFDEEQHRAARRLIASRPRLWRMRTTMTGGSAGRRFGIGLLLPELVGVSRAAALPISGRMFGGPEAASPGQATEAPPGDRVLTRAHATPTVVGLTKQLLYTMVEETGRESAFAREWQTLRRISRQHDSIEGVESFLAKRNPTFSGSKHADPLHFSTGRGKIDV
jgi:enoyl-CoA hydratase/carnithine racemase